jgi:Fe-S cluster assembly iron-binding protein IscA
MKTFMKIFKSESETIFDTSTKTIQYKMVVDFIEKIESGGQKVSNPNIQ